MATSSPSTTPVRSDTVAIAALVPFYKVSGAGNDFVVLVEPPVEPSADAIAAYCARAISLGADGLLVLRRQPGGARLIHYNADGQRSDFCLNGSRSAAQLAFQLGFAPPSASLALETDVGVLACRALDAARAEVTLPPGLVEPFRPCLLELAEGSFAGFAGRVGVPHYVLPWPKSLATAPVAELGPRLRRHPDLGPGGANVNFVRWVDEHRLEIRTFERGVEAETLACGSGVVAAVAAGLGIESLRSPVDALVSGGFELRVRREGDVWRLAGDARLVAHGHLLEGARCLPPPPRWQP
jgi:diaminopimelate epimerase